MLIKIFLKYILGYVRITVEGYYIERFINICTTNKILIWNLKREKGVKLHLNVGIEDFYRAIKVAKKLKDSPITKYKPIWADYTEENTKPNESNKGISKKGFKFY